MRLGRLVLLLALGWPATCTRLPLVAVPPIVIPPPVVVVLLPGPLTHDLTAWLDDDEVCVAVPPVQAVYLARRCLSMATIRSVILTIRSAE